MVATNEYKVCPLLSAVWSSLDVFVTTVCWSFLFFIFFCCQQKANSDDAVHNAQTGC